MAQKLPITPPVLQRELREAIRQLDELGKDQRAQMIRTFRLNRSKCIATWGLSNLGAKVEGLEPIGLDWYEAVARFEAALAKWRRFRRKNGGEDFLSRKVMRATNHRLPRGPRPKTRKTTPDALMRFLLKNGYYQSLEKAPIRERAMLKFSISNATFYRLLGEALKSP